MRALFVTLLAALSATCFAKDFGVQGTAWPILEQDMREYVLEAASKTDWDAANQRLKDSAEKYPETLAKRLWPAVSATSTAWMDPSIELTDDIQAPVKGPDGKLQWQVMVPRGTRVNPLAQVRPSTAMLFFDGSDPEQLAFVEQALKHAPGKLLPIEAGRGSVLESNKVLKVPVFHASDEAVQRFQLRAMPTLVYPGSGMRAMFLGNTVFAPPYSLSALTTAWPDIAKTVTAGKPE